MISELLWRMSKEETVNHNSAVTDLVERLSKIRYTVNDFYREFQTPRFSSIKWGANHWKRRLMLHGYLSKQMQSYAADS